MLWNNRLGHVNFRRKHEMSKDRLIASFDINTEKCITCMLTKVTKKPFPNVKRNVSMLELVHSDLCDFQSTPLLGNKKYVLTFTDDCTRFCYVYLSHPKDKALDTFKIYKIDFDV